VTSLGLPKTPGDPREMSWYTPDGRLYDVLADDALAWCGAENRYGRHCLLELKPVYPAQDVFQKLRGLARLFETAVLLVYGRPDTVPARPVRPRGACRGPTKR